MGRKRKTKDTRYLYDYTTLYRKICADQGRDKIADKEVGFLLGVSERQIRNAKFKGMDAYMADSFCISAGYHPQEVYEDWINLEGIFADDLNIGKLSDEFADFSLEEIDAAIQAESDAIRAALSEAPEEVEQVEEELEQVDLPVVMGSRAVTTIPAWRTRLDNKEKAE